MLCFVHKQVSFINRSYSQVSSCFTAMCAVRRALCAGRRGGVLDRAINNSMSFTQRKLLTNGPSATGELEWQARKPPLLVINHLDWKPEKATGCLADYSPSFSSAIWKHAFVLRECLKTVTLRAIRVLGEWSTWTLSIWLSVIAVCVKESVCVRSVCVCVCVCVSSDLPTHSRDPLDLIMKQPIDLQLGLSPR